MISAPASTEAAAPTTGPPRRERTWPGPLIRPRNGLRHPFLWVSFSAIGGIVVAETLRLPLPVSVAGFALSALASIGFARLSHAIWLTVAFASASLATLVGPASPAYRLADSLTSSWQAGTAVLEVSSTPRLGSDHATFDAILTKLELDGKAVRLRVPVRVVWSGSPPRLGDVWRAPGSIRNIPGARNPGEFDPRAWSVVRGIRSELLINSSLGATQMTHHPRYLAEAANAARRWIEDTLASGIAGTEPAAIIRGMTIGDTSDIPESTVDCFRQVGAAHLFSVSGLHVGMISLLLWQALGFLGVSGRRAALLLIPMVFFYALITGWKPASVRAAIMVAAVAGGTLVDRPANTINSLAAAACFILLLNPLELFSAGFQLSFVVVAAILAIGWPIQRWIDHRLAPDPFLPRQLLSRLQKFGVRFAREFSALTAVSLAAWIGSFPLSITTFHLVSVAALPANMCAVPLSFVILALALLALAVGPVSSWLASLLNNTNWLITTALVKLITEIASLPGSHFYVAPPPPPGTLATIAVLDCDRGAATVITINRRTWIIDAGSTYQGKSVVVPFLRSRGINQITGAILTHGDSSHVGGFLAVQSALDVESIYTPSAPDRSPTRKKVIASAQKLGSPVRALTAGDQLNPTSDCSVVVLHPPANTHRAHADDKALVLLITIDHLRILFTADSGRITETWLLKHVPDQLRCDILIAGRHFSGLPPGAEFLRAVAPTLIISSAADFPPAERPLPQWLATTAQSGARLLSQDGTGAVTLEVTAAGFSATPFLPSAAP